MFYGWGLYTYFCMLSKRFRCDLYVGRLMLIELLMSIVDSVVSG